MNVCKRVWPFSVVGIIASALFFGPPVALGQNVPPPKGESVKSLKKELPRTKPLEPQQALNSFQIEEGFHLELVAAEPLVTDPIALEFDEQGRMYVVEMRGYPFAREEGKIPLGRIRLLEDTNDDGRADRSTIFADELSWPTGVLPWDGGVFVAVAPDLVYLKDTDGDNVADLRRVVYTGFGTRNVQSLFNNLRWGPDNWIYCAGGPNGGEIRPGDRPDAEPINIRGRDFRFRPDTGEFQVLSGGGQFGHSLDDWGNRFVCNNSNPVRHIVLPGEYLARNPYLPVSRVLTDIAERGPAAPVHRISRIEPWRVVRTRWREASGRGFSAPSVRHDVFTGATGVTVYRGSAYPRELRGNVFLGDVQSNIVHRETLAPRGATFVASRAGKPGTEFLRSRDNWFRPVNLAQGPDGCLYVLDMYREVIEHPDSIPPEIKEHLDLTSGYDRGRIYRIAPNGFRRPAAPRLADAGTKELVATLEHADAWWRRTAHRLLLERKDRSAIAPLEAIARRSSLPQARLHALWLLGELESLDDALVLDALSAAHAGLREHAVRLAENRFQDSPALVACVLALADDPAPRVRFRVAFALALVRREETAKALAKIARRDLDDPWTRTAVLTGAVERPPALLETLSGDDAFLNKPRAAPFVGRLAGVIGARNRPDEVTAAIDAVVSLDADEHDRLRQELVRGLGEGLARAGGSLRAIFQGSSPAQRRASEVLAELFDRARGVASAPDRSQGERTEAIRLLGHAPYDAAGPSLIELLTAREPQAIQLAAVKSLSAMPGRAVGSLLVERWRSFSPPVRREVAEALFSRSDRLPALLDALEAGQVAVADLDPARLKALAEHKDAKIRKRAESLLAGRQAGDRGKVIERFQAALALKGRTGRGSRVFKRQCATCHKKGGEGQDVGPDLATTQSWEADKLLTNILDPNREVAPNYLNYTLVTTQGKTVTGIIAAESATSVTLRRAEGAEDTVLRSNIEELVSSGLSIMPEGLEKEIDPQAMADLLRFLKSSEVEDFSPTAKASRAANTE